MAAVGDDMDVAEQPDPVGDDWVEGVLGPDSAGEAQADVVGAEPCAE